MNSSASSGNPSPSSADPYAAIRGLPRPASRLHPPMERMARAAQFAPFSALSGYNDVIAEAGRLTSAAPALDDDTLSALDAKLHCLLAHAGQHPLVRIRYFVPDGQKNGGAYADIAACVKRIDTVARRLYFAGGESVCLDDVVQLESALFSSLSVSESGPDFPETGLVISSDR